MESTLYVIIGFILLLGQLIPLFKKNNCPLIKGDISLKLCVYILEKTSYKKVVTVCPCGNQTLKIIRINHSISRRDYVRRNNSSLAPKLNLLANIYIYILHLFSLHQTDA